VTGSVKTHYDNLKVARNAPSEVIRAAYRVLAQKYHPDLNAGDVDAARIMKLVNVAYDTLSDPRKRSEHDAWIAEREPPTAGADEMREPSVGEQMRSSYGADIPRSRQRPWQAADGPQSQATSRPRQGVVDAFAKQVGEFLVASYKFVVGAAVVVAGTWLLSVIAVFLLDLAKGRQNSTPVAPTASAVSKPIVPKYVRPLSAPNGRPWPLTAGYVPGYPVANRNGRSSFTIDNRQGGSDVFVKMRSLSGENAGQNVRHFYIPAGTTARASQLSPGGYDIRYQSLDSGALSRSELFVLS